jgi:hypothetical protein
VAPSYAKQRASINAVKTKIVWTVVDECQPPQYDRTCASKNCWSCFTLQLTYHNRICNLSSSDQSAQDCMSTTISSQKFLLLHFIMTDMTGHLNGVINHRGQQLNRPNGRVMFDKE